MMPLAGPWPSRFDRSVRYHGGWRDCTCERIQFPFVFPSPSKQNHQLFFFLFNLPDVMTLSARNVNHLDERSNNDHFQGIILKWLYRKILAGQLRSFDSSLDFDRMAYCTFLTRQTRNRHGASRFRRARQKILDSPSKSRKVFSTHGFRSNLGFSFFFFFLFCFHRHHTFC